MKKLRIKERNNLYKTILQLRNLNECHRFFRDLLTECEIREFAERWKAAQMLAKGISYNQIESETGLSTRTIARVARWLKRGRGGYAMMLKRMEKQK